MTTEEFLEIRDGVKDFDYDYGELLDKAVTLLDEVERLNKALVDAEARIERLRTALEAVEGVNDGVGGSHCPWCKRGLTGLFPHPHGHRADCQRQIALGLQAVQP